jgi:hypothetical protein
MSNNSIPKRLDGEWQQRNYDPDAFAANWELSSINVIMTAGIHDVKAKQS